MYRFVFVVAPLPRLCGVPEGIRKIGAHGPRLSPCSVFCHADKSRQGQRTAHALWLCPQQGHRDVQYLQAFLYLLLCEPVTERRSSKAADPAERQRTAVMFPPDDKAPFPSGKGLFSWQTDVRYLTVLGSGSAMASGQRSAAISRSLNFWILPLAVRGKPSTTAM